MLLRSFVACAALSLTGCLDLLSFDVTSDLPEQRVLGSVAVGNLLGDVPIEVDLAAEQEARSVGPLGKVFVSSMHLSITDTGKAGAGDVDNFDFLDAIDVFVSSGRAGTTLTRVRVATLSPVPSGQTSLSLDVTEANVKAHIEEGAVIEAAATGTIPPDDVTFDGAVVVTARVL